MKNSVGEELDEDDLDAELACLDDELDVSGGNENSGMAHASGGYLAFAWGGIQARLPFYAVSLLCSYGSLLGRTVSQLLCM